MTVTAMGQDAQGFLWIGTQTGLYRYDGARAKKMTEVESIIGHYISDLLIAPDGTPWFAGNHGIAHFHNGQVRSSGNSSVRHATGTGNQLFAVDGKGVVYRVAFQTGNPASRTGNPKATRVIGVTEGASENAAGIVRDADDSIWLTIQTSGENCRWFRRRRGGSTRSICPKSAWWRCCLMEHTRCGCARPRN